MVLSKFTFSAHLDCARQSCSLARLMSIWFVLSRHAHLLRRRATLDLSWDTHFKFALIKSHDNMSINWTRQLGFIYHYEFQYVERIFYTTVTLSFLVHTVDQKSITIKYKVRFRNIYAGKFFFPAKCTGLTAVSV